FALEALRDAGPSSVAVKAVEGKSRPSWKRVAALAMAFVLTAALAVLLVFSPAKVGSWRERLLRGHGKGNNTDDIHSLAGLPLKNLSGDPAEEYFADGMTE